MTSLPDPIPLHDAAAEAGPDLTAPPAPRGHRALAAAGFAAAVAGVAVAGARFGPADPAINRWYRSLDKPPFQPPNSVFGPVWGVLYASIAVSGWRTWQAADHPRRRVALGLWGVQLAANAAWTPTFFGARRPKAALAVLGTQLAATAAYTAVAARVDRPAAALMGPYLGWTGFAGVLNEEIVRRNP